LDSTLFFIPQQQQNYKPLWGRDLSGFSPTHHKWAEINAQNTKWEIAFKPNMPINLAFFCEVAFVLT
jgi:hypothetical protein